MLGRASQLTYQPLLNQGRDDGIRIHATHGLHALARDRLVVGNDGKGLERSLRELPRVPAQDIALHDIVVGRMREEAPAACDLAQLEATVRVGILCRELGKHACRLSWLYPQDLCKIYRRERI